MVVRGEIWWYEPPERKRRPFLILTRDPAIAGLVDVVGVPATRTVRGIPSEVVIGRSDGMPAEGALSFDGLALLTKALLTRRITALPSHRWLEVCAALNFTLAC